LYHLLEVRVAEGAHRPKLQKRYDAARAMAAPYLEKHWEKAAHDL
jgi:hypothetical protein